MPGVACDSTLKIQVLSYTEKKSFIFLFEANVIFLYFDCSSRLTCLSSTYNTQHFLLFQCDSTQKGLRESKFSHPHSFSDMSLKYVTEIKNSTGVCLIHSYIWDLI